jgi:hypothetical protein
MARVGRIQINCQNVLRSENSLINLGKVLCESGFSRARGSNYKNWFHLIWELIIIIKVNQMGNLVL